MAYSEHYNSICYPVFCGTPIILHPTSPLGALHIHIYITNIIIAQGRYDYAHFAAEETETEILHNLCPWSSGNRVWTCARAWSLHPSPLSYDPLSLLDYKSYKAMSCSLLHTSQILSCDWEQELQKYILNLTEW